MIKVNGIYFFQDDLLRCCKINLCFLYFVNRLSTHCIFLRNDRYIEHIVSIWVATTQLCMAGRIVIVLIVSIWVATTQLCMAGCIVIVL